MKNLIFENYEILSFWAISTVFSIVEKFVMLRIFSGAPEVHLKNPWAYLDASKYISKLQIDW